jgi:hypothetical protein
MTEAKMKHTETPWSLIGDGPDEDSPPFEIVDKHGLVIATVHSAKQYSAGINPELDAAFIVHAVNMHQKLVDALRKCKEEYWNRCYDGSGNVKAMTVAEFDRFVDPLITRAEGGK